MHDTLGYAFMVEMGYLFAQDEIFQQSRTAISGFQGILIVTDGNALVSR